MFMAQGCTHTHLFIDVLLFFHFNESHQSILFTVLFMMITMLTCGCLDWLNNILFCSVLLLSCDCRKTAKIVDLSNVH